MDRRKKNPLLTGMLVSFCLLNAGAVHGQTVAGNSTADTSAETFRLEHVRDRGHTPWAGNGAQLEKPAGAVAKEQAVRPATAAEVAPKPASPAKPYCFAVRTNVLYDALLLPTLGVEWRVNRDLGIKLDGSLAWWGDKHGKVQKMWVLNPEVRWYLLRDKRFYVGASANYGKYNIYKYALGGMLSKDTGYQGDLWGAGVTVGYQLYLSRSFSVDFNLGVGYTRSEYDSFRMTDGVRVYKDRDQSKNFWGPTQAGISLVWTIGK